MRPDDLIILIGDRLIRSCKALGEELEMIDFEDPVTITVVRDKEFHELQMQYREGEEGTQ